MTTLSTLRKGAFALLFAIVLMPHPALAVEPDEVLTDPLMELRAREISKQLRCVVCQNQSIDDSDAELAKDMRILVRERLMQGDADDEVIHYLVNAYGDFVLLKPPLKAVTYALWFGPILFAVLGISAVVVFIRKNQRGVQEETRKPKPLTPEEEAKLAKILASEEKQ
ncbi:MAG: cytochrome c-type biogenesis protein [Magnetospiraceae bacterium]